MEGFFPSWTCPDCNFGAAIPCLKMDGSGSGFDPPYKKDQRSGEFEQQPRFYVIVVSVFGFDLLFLRVLSQSALGT